MEAKEIITILECEVKDLMDRFDNSKYKNEKVQIALLVEHTVILLTQIKGTRYDDEYAYLWKKFNLEK